MSNGAYECFHCGCRAVIWDNDFSFEDMGYEGEGLVHICHCTNCGAEIEYAIADKEEKMSRETESCWLTGQYTDMCCCDICEHRYECSASNYDEDDDE